MHARALDVLHDARDEHVHAVRNGVHFELGAHEVLIAEHGVFDVLGEDDVHIAGDVVLREGDRHVLPADDVRGAQEHGIAERFRRPDRLLLRHDREPLGTGDIELFEKLVEALAILCPVDAVGARAEDGHARLIEIAAQLDGGLSAEGDDDAVGLFDVDDVLHVFGGKRLEVKPVCRVEVGGDRLGVVVDDDDFVAELFERPHAVDGGVVELDALPDADGARADDDDALFLAPIDEGLCLVVIEFVVGRIEVRRLRRELCRAGIDHLEARAPVHGERLPAVMFKHLIGIAELLAFEVFLSVRTLPVTERSNSTRLRSLFKNQRSILVMSKTSSTEMPALRAA